MLHAQEMTTPSDNYKAVLDKAAELLGLTRKTTILF